MKSHPDIFDRLALKCEELLQVSKMYPRLASLQNGEEIGCRLRAEDVRRRRYRRTVPRDVQKIFTRICIVRDSLRGNKANARGSCTFQRRSASIAIFALSIPFFHHSYPASPLGCRGCSSRRPAPPLTQKADRRNPSRKEAKRPRCPFDPNTGNRSRLQRTSRNHAIKLRGQFFPLLGNEYIPLLPVVRAQRNQ